ncbi:MAG: DUF4384 domain-containing protein [Hyphomicrobiaceae bacterium]
MASCALASGAGAQSPPDDALNQRASEILAIHCAPCREIGTLNASSTEARPIDLAAIARDPNLVRPGNPDGSPVYAEMMRRFIGPGTQPAPDIDSLATLRTWIESLPASTAVCPHASELTRRHIQPLLIRQAALVRKPKSALRVLTLAHLDAGCRTTEQLAGWREAIGLFMAALAGSSKPVPMLSLDEKSHHLAVDIQALGWDSDLWRVLTGTVARANNSNQPLIVRADWLIVHVLRGELGARFINPSEPLTKPRSFYDPEISAEDRAIVQAMLAGAAPPERLAVNVANILQLARVYLAPAGLSRVAAELGVHRTVLERGLATTPDNTKSLLLRLAYGTVPRATIEENWPALGRIAGSPPPTRTTAPAQPDAILRGIVPQTSVELSIYADRTHYVVGDPVQFTVRSNVDCRLTVISIDVSGYGTVIFPNDFVTHEALRADLDLVLPAPGAGYRFRVKEKGHERVVALCARAPGGIEGIVHDFERQRFQELGSYAAHIESELKSALERQAGTVERTSSARRKPPIPQHVPLQQLWRTGIVLDVD